MNKILQIITAFFLFSSVSFAENFSTAWETENVFELPESVIQKGRIRLHIKIKSYRRNIGTQVDQKSQCS